MKNFPYTDAPTVASSDGDRKNRGHKAPAGQGGAFSEWNCPEKRRHNRFTSRNRSPVFRVGVYEKRARVRACREAGILRAPRRSALFPRLPTPRERLSPARNIAITTNASLRRCASLFLLYFISLYKIVHLLFYHLYFYFSRRVQ